MQAQLFCATCAKPLVFKVPELTGNRWYARCDACGARTALEAILSQPEELATFHVVGVHSSPEKTFRKTYRSEPHRRNAHVKIA